MRFDDTELPGLRPTVGYLDLRSMSEEQLATNIMRKVHGDTSDNGDDRSPFWEHLLFGSELQRGLESLAFGRRDLRLGYSGASSSRVSSPSEVADLADAKMDELHGWVENLERILSDRNQEEAFGRPGEPGDEASIKHLAGALTRMNQGLLDWAMGLRATVAPEGAREVLWAASRFAEPSLDQFATFVESYNRDLRAAITQIETGLPQGEPIRLEISYTLELPDELTDDFNQALRRYRRRSG